MPAAAVGDPRVVSPLSELEHSWQSSEEAPWRLEAKCGACKELVNQDKQQDHGSVPKICCHPQSVTFVIGVRVRPIPRLCDQEAEVPSCRRARSTS